MLNGRFEDEAELAIAKAQMQRREDSLAAAQRARQRHMNLRLLGQFGAVLVAAAIVAVMYFF
jgi:hypothetical protein